MFESLKVLSKNVAFATTASLLALTCLQHTTEANSIQWEQWTVEAGGNGHWYGVTEETLNWDSSLQLATTLASTSGQPIQLAEINSAGENQFLVSTFQDTRPGSGWIGFTDSDALGRSEGSWGWLSGTPVTYTNWGTNPPEPNNDRGGEDFATLRFSFHRPVDVGRWNDLKRSDGAFAILESQVAIPEPSSCALALVASSLIGSIRRPQKRR